MSVAVVVAVISAIGAIVAAVIAGRSAARTKEAELTSARLLDLERRLASVKDEVYKPMVRLLQSMWDEARSGKQANQQKQIQTLSDFAAWVQMYGSDEVVLAFHKMMQAAFNDPPSEIVLRYIAEMTLALRKDLGDPETEVSLLDLFGHRINDIYIEEHQKTFTLSEPELWKETGWSPPWGDRFSQPSG